MISVVPRCAGSGPGSITQLFLMLFLRSTDLAWCIRANQEEEKAGLALFGSLHRFKLGKPRGRSGGTEKAARRVRFEDRQAARQPRRSPFPPKARRTVRPAAQTERHGETSQHTQTKQRTQKQDWANKAQAENKVACRVSKEAPPSPNPPINRQHTTTTSINSSPKARRKKKEK